MKPAFSRDTGAGGSVHSTRAFTMLELMLVVAIMGIILAMGFPAIRSALHKEAFVQGMNDILDACDFARKEAIMHDTVMEMRIYPQSGGIEVGAVARDISYDAGSGTAPSSPPPPPDTEAPPPVTHSFSAQLSSRITIGMLDVNFADYKDADVARIRFYPNGTSYEFTMVIQSETGDYRKITLEEVTALADAAPLVP